MKPDFRITDKADVFGKKLLESNSIDTAKAIEIIGIAIGIKDSAHQSVESCSKHKRRFSDFGVPQVNAMVELYLNEYPDSNPEEVYFNLEKAASHGIMIIQQKYYNKDMNIINWEKINEDYS